MTKITIGIDPSSKAHGVAIYKDIKLADLRLMRLMELSELARSYDNVSFAIENVLAHKNIYARNMQDNLKKQGKVGQNVGMNKQAFIELLRMLDYYEMPHILINPDKDNWANDKLRFERITGWRKRSNKDTRSAAFFGYLAL